MSKQNEELNDEQLNLLIANGNIAIQFEQTGNRVAVGMPFAVECSGGDWWLCCQQGKFRICVADDVLCFRGCEAENLRWVSILESYRAFLFAGNGDNPEQIPMPMQIGAPHADWLLGFLRHCVIVVVSDDPGIPMMPPETRAMVAPKAGVALAKIKQLIRRRGARRFQTRH
jgi:hypothetical protein